LKILAIETSTRDCTIAVAENGNIECEREFPTDQTTAGAIGPVIAELLAGAQWTSGDLNLIAVTVGPGSFTGLRIGVTAAKTLAYATSAEVWGCDTHTILAAQANLSGEPKTQLHAVLDAQRRQLFQMRFYEADSQWTATTGVELIENDAWLASLASGDFVTGTGLKKLNDRLPEGVIVCESSLWTPRASTLAKLAATNKVTTPSEATPNIIDSRSDLWRLAPEYHRLSAAEEKSQQNEN